MSEITAEYLTEIRIYPESVIAKAMCAIPVCGNDLQIFAESTVFVTTEVNVGTAVIRAQAEALANLSASVTAMRFVEKMSQPDESEVEPDEDKNVVMLRPPTDDDESTQRLLTEYIAARCAEDSEERAA